MSHSAVERLLPTAFWQIPNGLQRAASALADPRGPAQSRIVTQIGSFELRRITPASGETIVIARGIADTHTFADRYGLTPAELRVLSRLGEGKSQRQLAEELDVSYETVRTHTKRVLGKLDARDVAHAIRIAIRGGMLPG